MPKLIECIPNFSEGKNKEVLAKIEEVAKSVAGVSLLGVQSDESHNRSVFTLLGNPEGIEEVAFRLAKIALLTIDLRKHKGEHPRMGAMDVLPFVPMRGATIEECVEMSRRVAKRIYDELSIPSFLYEASATRPHTQNLASVRKGEFEGMPEKLLKDEWAPDFGERKVHETAGIIAIGARQPLVAFNVNLNSDDVHIAKEIAKNIRGSSGGYQCCKALGVKIEESNTAQVTMNMVDHNKTPLYRAFEAIRFEAQRYGVSIKNSEIIGLTPAKALIDCASYYLQLDQNFDADKQVLEFRLMEME